MGQQAKWQSTASPLSMGRTDGTLTWGINSDKSDDRVALPLFDTLAAFFFRLPVQMLKTRPLLRVPLFARSGVTSPQPPTAPYSTQRAFAS